MRALAGLLFCCATLLPGSCLRGQTPLTLHQAITIADAGAQARQGQDHVDMANGLVRQAGLGPNPRLFLQSEDLRPWDRTFSFENATEDYGYLSQTVELDGKRSRRIDLARANMHRVEAERAMLLQQIAGHVATAYWAFAAGARISRLLADDLTAVDTMVRYHKDRVDAGAMRGVDLLRMQVERDRLLIALAAARRDASLARIELFRQMGRPDDAQTQLADSLESAEPIPPQSVTAVLAARADVNAARQAVAAAEADVKLQKALGVPDLDLLGGYKRNSGKDTLYTSMQIPLPFRNRNQGEVQRAQASVLLARDQLQQLELTAAADVAAAEEAYARQQEIVSTVLPEMRAHAQQNLAIMTDAYRTGGVDLLRYIDAERTAIDVEVTALRTLAEYRQAALRLQQAYGVQP